MSPHAMSPLADISLDCKTEEIFWCLEKMKSGCSPPGNVITDVNPYSFAPSKLFDGTWYLIQSRETHVTEFGTWKVKDEASKLLSNPLIAGWRATLQFFEGHAPHEHQTDWMMQQYWITTKERDEDSKEKEGSSLCRVFLDDGEDPVTNSDSSNGCSKRKLEDKNADETGIFRSYSSSSCGDYIELQDLESPVSPPSSSSDNSSCFTMSSDEYFDPQALLQEIESDIKQELEHKNKDSIGGTELPAKRTIKPDAPTHRLAVRELGNGMLHHSNMDRPFYGTGAPSSSSSSVEDDNKAAKHRKKKAEEQVFMLHAILLTSHTHTMTPTSFVDTEIEL